MDKAQREDYREPTLEEWGSVADLTRVGFNPIFANDVEDDKNGTGPGGED